MLNRIEVGRADLVDRSAAIVDNQQMIAVAMCKSLHLRRIALIKIGVTGHQLNFLRLESVSGC